MTCRKALSGAIFLTVVGLLSAFANAETATCTCDVKAVTNQPTQKKWEGKCVLSASTYTDPYPKHKCVCGPNDEPLECSATATLRTLFGTNTQAEKYCNGLAEAESSLDVADYNTHCIVHPDGPRPLLCTGDESVKIDVNITVGSTNQTCSFSELRTLCDPCIAWNDTDAEQTWWGDTATHVCHCDATDTSSNKWVQYEAGCVSNDLDINAGRQCECGPLLVDCALRVENANLTTMTRVKAKRTSEFKCEGFPATQAYYTNPPCVDIYDNLVHDNDTGFSVNVKYVSGTTDHCIKTTVINNCTSATPEAELERFDCVMEEWPSYDQDANQWAEDCSTDCLGWQTRRRGIRYPAYNGGEPCSDEVFDRKACNTEANCTAGCTLAGTLTRWSPCTKVKDQATCANDPRVPLGWRVRQHEFAAGALDTCLPVVDYQRCYPDTCENPEEGYAADINRSWLGAASGALAFGGALFVSWPSIVSAIF